MKLLLFFLVILVGPFVLLVIWFNLSDRLDAQMKRRLDEAKRHAGHLSHDETLDAVAAFDRAERTLRDAKSREARDIALLALLKLPCPPERAEARERARDQLAAWDRIRADKLRELEGGSLIPMLDWARELKMIQRGLRIESFEMNKLLLTDRRMRELDANEDPAYIAGLAQVIAAVLSASSVDRRQHTTKIVRRILDQYPHEQWNQVLRETLRQLLIRGGLQSTTRYIIEHVQQHSPNMLHGWMTAYIADESIPPDTRQKLLQYARKRLDAHADATLQGGQLSLSVDPQTTGGLSLSDEG